MLIKVGNDLFRILELHHLTPGNKRAHIQVRMRNIRTLALADSKFRAEEDIERATLDEREMQYLYNDAQGYCFMDTSTYEQVHISAEALGDSKDFLEHEDLPNTTNPDDWAKISGKKGERIVYVRTIVNEGDKVRVNTETGEYQSRV